MNRRTFVQLSSVSAAALAVGCRSDATAPTRTVTPLPRVPGGTLTSRPQPPTGSVVTGLQPLGLAVGRDGMRFVPSTYSPGKPVPLIVLLHGAGGSSAMWFGSYANRAEAAGCALLAIDSRKAVWDLIAWDAYLDDFAFLDAALADTFSRVAIDPTRVAIAGFSIGAIYALGVGLTNGDMFGNVISYSPGYLPGVDQHGMPKVFDSHGREDLGFSIDITSRPIVAQLRGAGYDVEYIEFDGGHQVPQRISDRAFEWLGKSWAR